MASIRKIPGRHVWIACFTGIDGTRYQRSTGTRNEKEARKIADDFEDATRRQRTSVQVRRVVYELHARITGDSLGDTTFREFFTRFLKTREAELAPTTFVKYRKIGSCFTEHLAERADVPFFQISKEDVVRFRDTIASRLKTSTANNYLKVTKVFFRQAKVDGIIADNVAEDVPTLKVRHNDEDERQPFTVEQLRAILQRADGELYGIILFGYYSGLRLNDICLLTWRHVDTATRSLNRKTAKTGRRQILPLAEPLMDWLSGLPAVDDPNAPVFPNAYASVKGSESEKSTTISRRFGELLAELGLRPKRDHSARGVGRSAKRQTNALSFHSLRHSLTSHLKDGGVSEAFAMEIVGHNSAEMSRHYTKLGMDTMREVFQKLPDVTK